MKTLITVTVLLASMPALGFAAPLAAAQEANNGKPPLVSISAPAGQDRVRISVSLVSYPGVPERASCRMLFKATNESRDNVELSTQLHTFNTYKTDLNSWLVPTGTLKPGQTVERLYSCKAASFITLDQGSDYGWPRTCFV
ncbi:MAG TPA: hypothetical protein VLL76_00895, partial [Candidatus Omnitrophota bacterium]|nr:hypothetical protein [Candidatus Omnitrophota bacterium]